MADIHIQHYPTMQIPNLATAAATKAKNTAANQNTPTATASVSNQKRVHTHTIGQQQDLILMAKVEIWIRTMHVK